MNIRTEIITYKKITVDRPYYFGILYKLENW